MPRNYIGRKVNSVFNGKIKRYKIIQNMNLFACFPFIISGNINRIIDQKEEFYMFCNQIDAFMTIHTEIYNPKSKNT